MSSPRRARFVKDEDDYFLPIPSAILRELGLRVGDEVSLVPEVKARMLVVRRIKGVEGSQSSVSDPE